MPWEITIRPAGGGALGSLDQVQRALSRAWPEMELGWIPSGAEQLARSRVVYPEVLRAILAEEPAKVEGVLEVGELFVQVRLGPGPQVATIAAEVRGNGDPGPLLARLRAATGWVVVDDTTGQRIEGPGTPAGWAEFVRYRDGVVRDRP